MERATRTPDHPGHPTERSPRWDRSGETDRLRRDETVPARSRRPSYPLRPDGGTTPFADRSDAGTALASALVERGITADLVLAIGPDGLPVGRAAADRLGADLDLVVAADVGAPWNPDQALGAVAADGTLWRDEALLVDFHVTPEFFEAEVRASHDAARERQSRYRGDLPLPDLAEKSVLLVGDGLATAATTVASVLSARAGGSDPVTLGLPVASAGAVETFRGVADAVVAVESPQSVGLEGFYESRAPVSDGDARRYLQG